MKSKVSVKNAVKKGAKNGQKKPAVENSKNETDIVVSTILSIHNLNVSNKCTLSQNQSNEVKNQIENVNDMDSLTSISFEEVEEEGDLSVIIDGIINMNMNHMSRDSKINGQFSECEIENQEITSRESVNEKRTGAISKIHSDPVQVRETLVLDTQQHNGHEKKLSDKVDNIDRTEWGNEINQPDNFLKRVAKRMADKAQKKNVYVTRTLSEHKQLSQLQCNPDPCPAINTSEYSEKRNEVTVNPTINFLIRDSKEALDPNNLHLKSRCPVNDVVKINLSYENHDNNFQLGCSESHTSLLFDSSSTCSETENSLRCSHEISKDFFDDESYCITSPCSASLLELQSAHLVPFCCDSANKETLLRSSPTQITSNFHMCDENRSTAWDNFSNTSQCDCAKKPLQTHEGSNTSQIDVLPELSIQSATNIHSINHSHTDLEAVDVHNYHFCHSDAVCNTGTKVSKKKSMEGLYFKLFDTLSDLDDSVSSQKNSFEQLNSRLSSGYTLENIDPYVNGTEQERSQARAVIKPKTPCAKLNIEKITFNEFSPVDTGLSLAKRLLKKCPNQDLINLISNL